MSVDVDVSKIIDAFRDDARKGIERSRHSFDNKDYGDSAFQMQQAIEKELKAAFAYCYEIKTKDEARRRFMEISHDFKSLFDILYTVLNQESFNLESLNLGITHQDIKKFERDMNKNKIVTWKYSLGIDTGKPEFLIPIFDKIISHTKIDSNNITRDNVNLQAEFSKINRSVKRMMQRNKEKLGKKKFFDYFFGLNFELILKLRPHESISRYPEVVDGKSTTEIYKERHKDLKKLLNQTSGAIDDLEFTFKL